MTTAAIIVMSVSVCTILFVFLFCIIKVLSNPLVEEKDPKK